MKISFTSRILDFAGRRLIGEPNAVFGTPPGTLDQLYLIPADRTGHEALDPDGVTDPVWLRHRAEMTFLRREVQFRAGLWMSAAVLPIVLAGLLLSAGISASTSGIKSSWEAHKAQEAQAAAQAAQAKEQAAEQAKEAKEASQIDAIVAQYAQQCKQAAAIGQRNLTPSQIAAVSGFGCDAASGKITIESLARFAAKQKLEAEGTP